MGSRLAASISSALPKFNAAAKQVFAPGEVPLRAGDRLVQPDLAKTFRLIRDHGPAVFYGPSPGRALAGTPASEKAKERVHEIFGEPEIGRTIIETVQAAGGSMTLEDLAGYRPVIRRPVSDSYRGYEIAGMPPPSSGGLTLLQMLKILEGFDIAALGHNTGPTLHLLAEAMRLAYADRAVYLADGDFVDIPYAGYLDERYIAERRALISWDVANANIEPGDPWSYEGKEVKLSGRMSVMAEDAAEHTTHFTVRDRWGNLVAYTTTIEIAFGSGMMVPGYGFMLNNELTDFDFTPGGVNEVAPHKRPRSSMTPTIVFQDGQPVFTVGSPGGARIITTVMQVIMNMIDHGMSVQEAIDARRIHSASYPYIEMEMMTTAFSPETRNYLIQRGHAPRHISAIGSVQSIVIDLETGQIYGGADARREGTVIGVE